MLSFLSIKRRALLVVVLAWAAGPAAAASLLEAVRAAREYDAGIAGARDTQQAGQETGRQGLAGLLPQVRLEGGYTRQDQPAASYAAAVRRHGYSVSVRQPIVDVPGLARYRLGRAQARGADIGFELADQALTLAVARDYLGVSYQRAALQAADAAVQAFGAELERVRALLRIGDATRTEVDEAQSSYDEALAGRIAAAADLEVTSLDYRRLTGLRADEIAAPDGACEPLALPFDPELVADDAAEHALEVRAARARIGERDADLLAANGAHLPTVQLEAAYGTRWSRGTEQNWLDVALGTTSKTRDTVVGVTVTLPLFTGGEQWSRSREAVLRRDAARHALEDARRIARQEARAASLEIINGLALYRARMRAQASARQSVESTRYGHVVGLRTVQDELTAQQRYHAAIRATADARYRYQLARLRLSAALGAVSDDALAELECGSAG